MYVYKYILIYILTHRIHVFIVTYSHILFICKAHGRYSCTKKKMDPMVFFMAPSFLTCMFHSIGKSNTRTSRPIFLQLP